MNVLILGGTGAIGKAIVQVLSKDSKYKVFVTSRKDNKSVDNVYYIKGNAHDDIFLKDILLKNNYDVIIDFMVYHLDEFSKRIDFVLNNTKQYIFLSSARVYSNESKVINEDTKRLLDVCKDKEYIKTNEYALEKAKEENYLINNDKKNWTIIRPYITYNNNRLQLGVYEKEEWLYRVIKGKKVVIPSQLLTKETTMTYGGDVSKYIAKLIFNKKSFGQIYQIVNNNYTTWNKILKLYIDTLEEYGYKFKYIIANHKTDYKLPINKYQLFYDRYYNRKFYSDKLKNDINEEILFMDISKLKNCLQDYLNNYDKNNIVLNPKYTGKIDRITGEKTSLNEFKGPKNKLKYILARYTDFFTGQ